MIALRAFAASTLVLSVVDVSSAAECPRSFEAAVEQTVSSINDRDIERFMATIGPQGVLMVLPDGTTIEGRDIVESWHRSWFEDRTFEFRAKELRTDVRETVATGLYRVTVDRPDRPGEPFLMGLTFLRDASGCWFLFQDQNTPLASDD